MSAADPARLLAEAAAARALLRDRPAAHLPSAADLWRHVRRSPGVPASLATARAIRADPAVARRYRTLLAGSALAHAPSALAASSGTVVSRRVGPYDLVTVSEDQGPPLLVLECGGAAAPTLIETVLGEDTVRLSLPEPAAGSIVIALDPAVPDAVRLGRQLSDPRSEVYLL